jgi:hypothetical protein
VHDYCLSRCAGLLNTPFPVKFGLFPDSLAESPVRHPEVTAEVARYTKNSVQKNSANSACSTNIHIGATWYALAKLPNLQRDLHNTLYIALHMATSLQDRRICLGMTFASEVDSFSPIAQSAPSPLR